MEYLKVHNWTEFQHYKDDRPLKWIKVYSSILVDYKFDQLSDSEFGQLVKIWILASQLDNKIPNDPIWIQKKTGLSTKPNISKYVQLGFLDPYEIVRNRTESETSPYLEKSRVEKSRDRENTFTKGDHFKTTDEKYQKLVQEYGKSVIDDKIEQFNDYCASKGKRFKDHAATIRVWLRKDNVPRVGEKPGHVLEQMGYRSVDEIRQDRGF